MKNYGPRLEIRFLLLNTNSMYNIIRKCIIPVRYRRSTARKTGRKQRVTIQTRADTHRHDDNAYVIHLLYSICILFNTKKINIYVYVSVPITRIMYFFSVLQYRFTGYAADTMVMNVKKTSTTTVYYVNL